MNIRSIWFDLDDTLIPSEPTYAMGLRSAWIRFRQTKAISWTQFQLRYEKARREVKTQLGSSPSARNRLLYFNRLIGDVLGHTHPELTQAMYEAYNSHWRNLKLKPVQHLLQRLAKTSGTPIDFPIVIRRGGPRDQEAFEMLRNVKDFDLHLYGGEVSVAQSAKIMADLAKQYAAVTN
jgi:FMN phosphatase YigB (HAD superfamily)